MMRPNNHRQKITEISAQIAQLEAVRGTPDEPLALDAQLGQLHRTLRWHQVRAAERHHNTGFTSLHGPGPSKRPRPPDPAPLVSLGR